MRNDFDINMEDLYPKIILAGSKEEAMLNEFVYERIKVGDVIARRNKLYLVTGKVKDIKAKLIDVVNLNISSIDVYLPINNVVPLIWTWELINYVLGTDNDEPIDEHLTDALNLLKLSDEECESIKEDLTRRLKESESKEERIKVLREYFIYFVHPIELIKS